MDLVAFLPQLGGGELLIIALIIILLFGAGSIPKLARGMGDAIRELRKASKELAEEDPKK